MNLLKNTDWSLVGFVAMSSILDYYWFKMLAWRISVDIPTNEK